MITEDTIFCSVDLELTGFNPVTDEILEVGFVKFHLTKNGAEPLEQWSQVFRPAKSVRSKILALTGISQQEAASSPLFSELAGFITEKLAGTILVGHGISLDVKFLQTFGVGVPSKTIDTLDLAQVFLPTHHSYNLENLMHFLEVVHVPAHRALHDAEVTMQVLVRLLQIAQSLPQHALQHVQEIAEKAGCMWAGCLPIPLAPWVKDIPKVSEEASATRVSFEPGSIAVVHTELALSEWIASRLEAGTEKQILVCTDERAVLTVWKSHGFSPIWHPSQQFNEAKFQEFLEKPLFTVTEAIFAAKVIVWKELNWQHLTTIDLNVSFSGSQYKQEISGGLLATAVDDQVVVTDYKTFMLLARQGLCKNRSVVLESLLAFEEFLGNSAGSSASWGGALVTLRRIYNPETDSGDLSVKSIVLEALGATDLYFGLVKLLLQKHQSAGYVVEETVDPFVWGKFERATEHYIDTLGKVYTQTQITSVQSLLRSLQIFLSLEPGTFRWLELSETKCVLLSKPLSLQKIATELLAPYRNFMFIESVQAGKVLDYYKQRLGLDNFSIQRLTSKKTNLELRIMSQVPTNRDLINLVTSRFPSLILFSKYSALQDFYDSAYADLKTAGSVFALGYSGGTNKLIRNYQLSKQSILLVTLDFLEKQLKMAVPTNLIIFPDFASNPKLVHPYRIAQSSNYPGGIEAFSKLLLCKELGIVWRYCYAGSSQTLYIFFDPTLESEKEVRDVFEEFDVLF